MPQDKRRNRVHAMCSYSSVVGSLMYAMECTQLDISHAVGVLRRYMSTSGKEHLTAEKRVFRYLYGMMDYGICYGGKHENKTKSMYMDLMILTRLDISTTNDQSIDMCSSYLMENSVR